MAKGFNKVILMGNLTRDPEVRTTPNGQSVANFSLAVNRTWRDVERPNSGRCQLYLTAWHGARRARLSLSTCKRVEHCLSVVGLDQRSWEDKDSGGKRSKVEVIVEDFNFVDGGSGGGNSDFSAPSKSSSSSSKTAEPNVEDIDDKPIDLSEIPF